MTSPNEIHPLTPERWRDLEIVFGDGKGVCSRCWCMFWRTPRATFGAASGEANQTAFRARVEAGPPPGLIAYRDGEPVGWVQVGPRADTPEWNGARRLSAPLDAEAAANPGEWGVTCFAVKTGARGRGASRALLDAAIARADKSGVKALEACPVETDGRARPRGALFHGVASSFARAGFREVARRKADRPLMRLEL